MALSRLLPTIVWAVKVCYRPLPPRTLSDRRAVRVKCSPDDTVGDLKKLIAAQTGTDHKKIRLKKW
jgi:hypothetical protein